MTQERRKCTLSVARGTAVPQAHDTVEVMEEDGLYEVWIHRVILAAHNREDGSTHLYVDATRRLIRESVPEG